MDRPFNKLRLVGVILLSRHIFLVTNKGYGMHFTGSNTEGEDFLDTIKEACSDIDYGLREKIKQMEEQDG